MKRFVSLLLSLALIFTISIPVFAESPDTLDEQFQQAYDYNRRCDQITGEIIEKYDNLQNGINSEDFVALSTSFEKSDRIAAMNKITELYDLAEENEKMYLQSYILSYSPYAGNESLINYCNSKFKSSSQSYTVAALTYNRLDALNYADKYYNSYNTTSFPNLSSLGGDCANFVSQCLNAGGVSMQGDWYIYKKNSNYTEPTNTSQLNESWTLADPSPWISAKEFNNYWSNRAVATSEYSVSDYKKDHKTIYNSSNVIMGDAIQLLKPVFWWYEGSHTMIIFKYDSTNRDIIYAAHTNNTKTATLLKNVCDNSNYSSYHIKFFHIA